MENIQSLNKKSKNSRKKYLKIRANPEVLGKGSSNLSDSNVRKVPPIVNSTNISQETPKFVQATGKQQKSKKRINKVLKKY